jgi:ABC-2 type transport system ATP-binding protein
MRAANGCAYGLTRKGDKGTFAAGMPYTRFMLKLENIQKTFRAIKREVKALTGVGFSVQAGEVVALLGANGAGKTTTMRIITGLMLPDAGSVRLEGFAPNTAGYTTRLGALLDTARSSAARFSVLENLEYAAALRGLDPKLAKARALQLTEELGLTDKRTAAAQTLSKGMQSKLALATALIHQPRCLLLDEPTLGLDLEASDALEVRVKEMAQSGTAVLLTTHQMEVAQRLADRVVILVDGSVLLDQPKAQLLSSFGAQTYRITLAQAPDNLVLDFVYSLDGNVLTVTLPAPDALYALFEVLRPQTIHNIEKLEADLGVVFRRVMHGAGVQV